MSQKLCFLQDLLVFVKPLLGVTTIALLRGLRHQPSWFEAGVPERIWETIIKDRLGETAAYRSKLFL